MLQKNPRVGVMARRRLKNKLFCYFFGFFFDLHFAEGFSLSRVFFLALGKGFAVCPIKGPRQRPLRRLKISRELFGEGFWPKEPESRSGYSTLSRVQVYYIILYYIILYYIILYYIILYYVILYLFMHAESQMQSGMKQRSRCTAIPSIGSYVHHPPFV
jgi:hypothetical protein